MKLLVLDVEGTIFQATVRLPGTEYASTIWQGIANALGPEAIKEEVESHKTWERGGYQSYTDWMKATIRIHQKYRLSRKTFKQLIASAQYCPGVVETLNQVDRSKYELLIVSGGFRELAARAQKDIDIQHAFAACEYLFGDDGTLKNFNLLPCDFAGKINFINLMLRELHIEPNDWIFIGDGLNDASVAKQAPISIGYRPHPKLAEVATHTITEFPQLLNILNNADNTQ